MPTPRTALAPRFYFEGTLTPASVASATVANQTFAVTGLTTDMLLTVVGPSPGNAVGAISFRVSASDTLQVTYCNPTAGALTPTAGTHYVIAF